MGPRNPLGLRTVDPQRDPLSRLSYATAMRQLHTGEIPGLYTYTVEEGMRMEEAERSALEVDVDAALRSASVAIVWAVATDRVARLQVSGDMGRTVMEALEYVDGLIAIGEQLRAHYGPDTDCAWTYTALPIARGLDYVRRLKQVGIHVRLSGHNGHNGAIVYPHATIEHLPAPANYRDYMAKPLACPAQRTKNAIDCQTCTACWTRPNRTIVFDPHGPRKRLATETATA